MRRDWVAGRRCGYAELEFALASPGIRLPQCRIESLRHIPMQRGMKPCLLVVAGLSSPPSASGAGSGNGFWLTGQSSVNNRGPINPIMQIKGSLPFWRQIKGSLPFWSATNMQYLGIDVGTSFIKGGVLNPSQLSIHELRRSPAPDPLANENQLLHEIRPDDFVVAVRHVIDQLLPTLAECRGIFLCGQMGGLVLTDASGDAVSNYISWLDRRMLMPHPRGGTYFDQFCADVGNEWPIRLGNEFRPGLPIPFLYWLKENSKLPDGVIPVTLPDYVAAQLCGERPVMEWTSATSLVDVTVRDWPKTLLNKLDLDEIGLPELVDFRHQVGEYHIGDFKLPVYSAVGDHQCALAGTLLKRGELSINISTGSQVAMIANGTDVGNFQMRPYFDQCYLKTITNIPAGRALSALMKLLTEISTASGVELDDPWAYAFGQAQSTAQSDMQVNLAFFPSSVEGPGQLANLNEGNLTVGHLFRAALEQMADYYEMLARRLSPNGDWTRLVFSGGIAQRSRLLRELVCDRLGDNHRLTTSTEDTMLGLLMLARVVSGHNSTVEEACQEAERAQPG